MQVALLQNISYLYHTQTLNILCNKSYNSQCYSFGFPAFQHNNLFQNMSRERSRTPSPHKQKAMERGAFSSLSTLTFYKSQVEDRRNMTASATLRTLPSNKNRSPVKSRLNNSQSPQTLQRKEARKSPELTRRSPIRRITTRPKEDQENLKNSGTLSRIRADEDSQKSFESATKSAFRSSNGRGDLLIRQKQEDEINKLNEANKRLSAELNKRKKQISQLEAENMELRKNQKLELVKAQNEIERYANMLQKEQTGKRNWVSERERLLTELKSSQNMVEACQAHLKALGEIIVVTLSSILQRPPNSLESSLETIGDHEEEFRFQAVDEIALKLRKVFEQIRKDTSTDLSQALNEVMLWRVPGVFPTSHQVPSEKLTESLKRTSAFTSSAGSYLFASEDEPTQDLVFNVEYYSDTPTKPAHPTPSFNDQKDDSNIFINSGFGNKNEMSFSDPEFALALYDFNGEREGDLQFSRGEYIEILDKNESGWWVGRLGNVTGMFPFNFVQVLQQRGLLLQI